MSDPATLRLDDFAQRCGEVFAFGSHGQRLELTLAEVTPGFDPGGGRRQAFSLVFAGPPEPLLAQGTHRFEHEQLGVLDIFIVPIGLDASAARYEAVFS